MHPSPPPHPPPHPPHPLLQKHRGKSVPRSLAPNGSAKSERDRLLRPNSRRDQPLPQSGGEGGASGFESLSFGGGNGRSSSQWITTTRGEDRRRVGGGGAQEDDNTAALTEDFSLMKGLSPSMTAVDQMLFLAVAAETSRQRSLFPTEKGADPPPAPPLHPPPPPPPLAAAAAAAKSRTLGVRKQPPLPPPHREGRGGSEEVPTLAAALPTPMSPGGAGENGERRVRRTSPRKQPAAVAGGGRLFAGIERVQLAEQDRR